ncbi:MAG: transcription factor S, partial [Nitrososphaerota archaeon]
MEFCPKCGKVMLMKKKSSNVVLVCSKCGYEKKLEEEVIVTTDIALRKKFKPEVVMIETTE